MSSPSSLVESFTAQDHHPRMLPAPAVPLFGAERRSEARRDRRGQVARIDRRGAGGPDPRGPQAHDRRVVGPEDRRGKPRRAEAPGVFAVDVPRYATRVTPVIDIALILFCVLPILAVLVLGLT